MKTVLTTLNAKYIHTSLALRWLYVANKERFDIVLKEYVLKEDIQKIANDLLVLNPDIIGMGIYIWNVNQSLALASILKACKPSIILIAGGPEVSYEPEFFLNTGDIDFVISGEGEYVLGELLSALENHLSGDYTDIHVECVSSQYHINTMIAKANLKKLAGLPSPYMLNEDSEERKNRIVYVETSRGCPYACTYCLSSLEKSVRYFPPEYIFKNLEYLIENNARQVKFLDRTFNLNQKHTRAIFDFLIARYKPGLSFQFEIYADLLTDELIDHLNDTVPPHYFRFEIGIQSTFEPAIRAIKRKQNFKILAAKIQKLIDGQKIDLHLDLIAGLPFETYDQFKQSFNDVFALRPKEIQLGFLKMLRGTSLRRDTELHGYQYNPHAPYEIIQNNYLTAAEIKRLHVIEHVLETYWNSGKFKRTMKALFDTTYLNRYFELFDAIGQYNDKRPLPNRTYRLEDIFLHLHHFLLSININLFEELRKDYYSCFKIRPHGFWENRIDKKLLKQWRNQIANNKPFLQNYQLNRKIIEKQTAIDFIDDKNLLLTILCADGSRETPLFLSYPII